MADYIRRGIIATEENPPYQEVTYIESSGTQYIESGVVSGPFGLKGKINIVDNSQSGIIMGCDEYTSTTSEERGWLGWDASNNPAWWIGNGYVTVGGTAEPNNDYEFIFNNFATHTALTVNDVAQTWVNDNPNSRRPQGLIASTSIFAATSYDYRTPSILSHKNYAKAKLYYLKVYSDYDYNILVRDYIPCYLTESVMDYWGNTQQAGAIGLWDKVSDKFFPNNGTGEFVAGDPVVPVPDFSTATWAEIQAYIDSNGTAGFADQVGATRSVTLSDSSVHTLRLANVEGNLYELSDGSGYTGMIVEFTDCLLRPRYSQDNSNVGTLAESRPMGTTTLPGIKATLPSDLQAVLATVKVIKANSGTDSTLVSSDMDLFIPAEKEVFGSATPIGVQEESNALIQWKYYESHTSASAKYKDFNSTRCEWWLRTPRLDRTNAVCCVSVNGAQTYLRADILNSVGVSPCFCLAPQSASRLPSGYTEVEYIQGTGTQVINTGVVPKRTLDVIVDATMNNNDAYTWLMGSYISNSNAYGLQFGTENSSKVNYYCNSSAIWNISSGANIGTRYLWEIKNSQFILDGTVKSTVSQTETTTTVPLAIIGSQDASSNLGFKCMFYGCTITDSDTLIRNFVPCIRESDGAVGLYDLCESASPFDGTPFYGNAGSGVFISGDPV